MSIEIRWFEGGTFSGFQLWCSPQLICGVLPEPPLLCPRSGVVANTPELQGSGILIRWDEIEYLEFTEAAEEEQAYER